MNRELKKNRLLKRLTHLRRVARFSLSIRCPARISVPKHLYAAKFPLSRKAYG